MDLISHTKELKRIVVTQRDYTPGGKGWRSFNKALKEIQVKCLDIERQFFGCMVNTYGLQTHLIKKKAKEITGSEGTYIYQPVPVAVFGSSAA